MSKFGKYEYLPKTCEVDLDLKDNYILFENKFDSNKIGMGYKFEANGQVKQFIDDVYDQQLKAIMDKLRLEHPKADISDS